MIRINQLKLPVDHGKDQLLNKAARTLKLPADQIKSIRIVKQSVDARKKPDICFSYVVDVETAKESAVVHKAKNTNVMLVKEKAYEFPQPGEQELKTPPVIVGCGPAGLFCGLMLARAGYCPVLLERGEDVDSRKRKVSDFWLNGILDTESNVQFGEGGAGTFSDGKLNTLVKDPVKRNQKVLEILAEFGADPAILYQNKPHIGTDVLSGIVKNIRTEIIRLGGSVHFLSCVTDFKLENGRLREITVNGKECRKVDALVLAIGHSARDTFEILYGKNVPMQQKSFAVGLRIQHPQKMINLSQYGTERYNEILGTASYKLTKQTSGGRGVYSFCMCPGGYVVDASSEPGRLAVNGMSDHARDGLNANSALIVTVTPDDFPNQTALAGVEYQRNLESLAYQYGGGKIPVQLYGDFKAGRESISFGDVAPELKGRYQFANLREMLPSYLSEALIEGVDGFESMIKGFARHDAIFAGIESRTSSPVRIERNSEFESEIKGIFPCGEGAGYAGGITSAAMDGIKIAEEITRRYKPLK